MEDSWLSSVKSEQGQAGLLRPAIIRFESNPEGGCGQSDQLLFDPCDDERAASNLRQFDLQLSCPKCFCVVSNTTKANSQKPSQNHFDCDYMVSEIQNTTLNFEKAIERTAQNSEEDPNF